MVTLDLGSIFRTRLNDVGIQGSLHKKLGVGEVGRDVLENADKQFADNLPLLLWINYASELVKEAVLCVDVNEVGGKVASERLLDLFPFAPPS